MGSNIVTKPVLAIVLNLLLAIMGLVCMERIPLREYPNIDPPIISVKTQYTGAAAQTVENTITKILEKSISGISGIRTIDARSEDGLSFIDIEFNLGKNIDNAANDVRDRVFAVLDKLPRQVEAPVVEKTDSNNQIMMWIDISSKKMTVMELTDYAERYLVDNLSVLPGVAKVLIGGGKSKSMRIWLNSQAMINQKVTIDEIKKALQQNNIELPAGRIESKMRDFSIRVERVFQTPEDFKQLVIKQNENNQPVRLGDVAKIEIGPENQRIAHRGLGINLIGIGIVKQSDANTLEVSRTVYDALDKLRLPEHMVLLKGYDISVYIKEALKEVLETFVYAFILVVLVIYLFLGSLRAMLIPVVAIPLSIISSFIVLYALGYSLNLLTLLGFVLAIGLVVDDAIVVLEIVQKRISRGEPPLLATYLGTKQVAFAVVATTTVLLAVFLPVAFLEGDIGRLFREFAVTISSAVFFSGFIALTLIPVMCASLLGSTKETRPWQRKFNDYFARIEKGYKRQISQTLKRPYLLAIVFIGIILSGVFLYRNISHELLPEEDRGTLYVIVKAPEGAGYDYMDQNMKKVEDIMMSWVKKEQANLVIVYHPRGLENSELMNTGFGILELVDINERNVTTAEVYADLEKQLKDLPGIVAIPIMGKGINPGGISQSVQIVLGGNNYNELLKWQTILLQKAKANPGLVNIESDYNESKLQLSIKINYTKASNLGISVLTITNALETYFGSSKVTTFQQNGEEYDVILEAKRKQKMATTDFETVFVRSDMTDRLVPISDLITIDETAVPNTLYRYNGLNSITISANLKNNYTLGQALDFFKNVVGTELPSYASINYKGISKAFMESSNQFYYVLALSFIVMYLILSAQFGSFIHPIVIFITAPLAFIGALLGLFLTHTTINLYSQIALIMLIGLAAKNGILMVEMINQMRESGHSFKSAIVLGCVERLRPILMTTFCTLIGSVPLLLTYGYGGQSRFSIGIVVLFGVSIATLFTLFYVPIVYFWIARKTKPKNAQQVALNKQLSDSNQTEQSVTANAVNQPGTD